MALGRGFALPVPAGTSPLLESVGTSPESLLVGSSASVSDALPVADALQIGAQILYAA